MISETSLDMVILAMDVRRDGPTDGHVAGTRRDGDEVATRDEQAHQFVEAHTGTDGHGIVAFVDDRSRRSIGEGQHATSRVLRGVTVTSTQAPNEDPATR
jgi:hypothetical protein